jgi:alkyl sulfatase BDS1-like metallo-beta-lactamase superfamily hydrolase
MDIERLSPSFADRTDFENASRGFIDALKPCIIKASNGRVVWNNDDYDFLRNECPATANPKLWRQGQLNSTQGLFEVTHGIYQIRGFDISNLTVVEGRTGVIVIDPLVSAECAEAALALYRKHRGNRSVTGLIYSHSHIDHFGGAQGVLPRTPDGSINIPIIAPEGFMDEATSENVFAGPAMRRRAAYMYGNDLRKGPDSQIGCGLGMTVSSGTNSLIPPNEIIKSTGEERVVDGVRIVFQVVPETEAPAEINFYFPDHRALCIAECATHCMHNIITLRGALVRDAKAWSGYLDETMVLFGQESDVLFAGHNWPTWGRGEIMKLISEQRDLYAYLHDQTLRMMNMGMTGIEIAEKMTLPPALQKAWHAQGYYGSVSHNVKGIYQRYMTWFDGNPAHLWQYPPAEEGKRYVACMGGIDELVRKAEEFEKNDDLRFATTLLGHAVAAEPTHATAKTALASVFEKLGHGAENATWRNFYLTGAQDLRVGKKARGLTTTAPINPGLSVDQWLAGLSVRVDGPRAANESFAIDLHVPDERRRWRLTLSNGALTHRSQPDHENFVDSAGLGLTLSRAQLLDVLGGNVQVALENKRARGEESLLSKLLSLVSIIEPTAGGASRL